MKKKRGFQAWVYLFAVHGLLLCAGFGLFSLINLQSLKKITYNQTLENLRTFAFSVKELLLGLPDLDSEQYGKLDDFIKSIASRDPDFRISIIDSRGLVVADSDTDSRRLENHGNRPEIQDALTKGEGNHIRVSTVSGLTQIYFATPLEYKDIPLILRMAIPVEKTVFFSTPASAENMAAAALIFICVLLLSFLSTSLVLRPLNELKKATKAYSENHFDFRARIRRPSELTELGEHMASMAATLEKTMKNLSEQREESEAVFAGIREALFVLDASLHIIKTNQAAQFFFRFPAQKTLSVSLLEIIRSAGIIDFVRNCISPAQNEKSTAPEIEAEYRRDPDSAPSYFLARCTAIPAATRNEKLYLLTLTDITHIKNLERIRRDFVANVSHELKTPITAIQGFVETLQDGALKDISTAEHFLGIISRESKRLNNIVDDLLMISRLEQGSFKLEKELCSLEELFFRIKETYAKDAEQKKIAIIFSGQASLEVRANSRLLEQALGNLVQNAVKYCPEKASINVTASRQLPEKNSGCPSSFDGEIVEIVVQDTGIGISQHDRERIFERFYRVDKGRSREYGGTGLGLSIVRHIALAHGGSVKETGRTDGKRGARFVLTLPAD